jgi:hypothetical protein
LNGIMAIDTAKSARATAEQRQSVDKFTVWFILYICRRRLSRVDKTPIHMRTLYERTGALFLLLILRDCCVLASL